jgi:hypothetical protein
MKASMLARATARTTTIKVRFTLFSSFFLEFSPFSSLSEVH